MLGKFLSVFKSPKKTPPQMGGLKKSRKFEEELLRSRPGIREIKQTTDAPSIGWTDDVATNEFWELCHEKESVIQLSGNRGAQVWHNLRVTPLIKKGATVLNIGVGLGYCTKDLVDQGCRVQAMDISSIALERIQSLVEKTWLAADQDSLPKDTFDLALSHLVAQHMVDEDLKKQMTAVVKALKPNGRFAIQLSYPLDTNFKSDPNASEQSHAKAGSIYRSLSRIALIVEAAGGRISDVYSTEIFPENGLGWYAVHVEKSR